MDEKSWVDPPSSPTTPASYRPLFCNLKQFRPYGKTTSFRTHACCKTHVFTLCRTTMLNLSQITKHLLGSQVHCVKFKVIPRRINKYITNRFILLHSDALNCTFYETRFTVIYKCNRRDNNNHYFSSLGPIW